MIAFCFTDNLLVEKNLLDREMSYMYIVFCELTLACIVVKMKDYTQDCYVGERLGLVGVGELYINNIVSEVHS